MRKRCGLDTLRAIHNRSRRGLMKKLLVSMAGLLAANLVLAQTNVALSGSASQSSTGFSGFASLAIDGNTGGNFYGGTVTHTNLEAAPWWQVVLAADAPVVDVIVWNRTDCCAERLSDYTVTLWLDGAQVASAFFAGQSPVSQSFSFGGQLADTVRVQLRGSDYLSLAEVQVFTPAIPEPQTAALLLGGLGLMGLKGSKGWRLQRQRRAG
jgi:hypothetical protein